MSTFTGAKLIRSLTTLLVNRCVGVSTAFLFRLRKEGQSDCTMMLCCCGIFKTP